MNDTPHTDAKKNNHSPLAADAYQGLKEAFESALRKYLQPPGEFGSHFSDGRTSALHDSVGLPRLPSRVEKAVEYALLGEGKRIRPLLTLMTCEAAGGDHKNAMGASLAIEMIHTYSLVHDDLPAMDDDSLRRGRPTVHVKFDEATAVLAGDALLTDAFHVLTAYPCSLGDSARLEQIAFLSRAAGSSGMVLGQSLDMEATGKDLGLSHVEHIHILKTGALLGACFALGALAANVSKTEAETLFRAGTEIGLAYQILDDLLDCDTENGKTPGKDADSGKSTYSSLGYKKALAIAAEITEQAKSKIVAVCPDSRLEQFVDLLLTRKK